MKSARAAARGSVRIIGGRWRGTRIAIADVDALRPSADRTRETVFNWIGPQLSGGRCLDLFAGTGAFAFEAVSRGASGAVAVERDGAAVSNMRALRSRLGDSAVSIVQADVHTWLTTSPAAAFDFVFIDPPFAGTELGPTLAALEGGWLAPTAQVYVECARDSFQPPAPWQVLKRGRSRHAEYLLLSATADPYDPSGT